MGAATSLLYSKESPVPIAGLILDSCFSEFRAIALNLVAQMGMPAEFFEMMWPMIVKTVNEATDGMNLKTHNPVAACPKRNFPVLFVHACDDELVPMEHTEQLFEKYAGDDKDAIYCEGTHNTERPEDVRKQTFQFISKKLLE
jgi:dipeptidyl aminopeptidase/acylaminoacyl peptidase